MSSDQVIPSADDKADDKARIWAEIQDYATINADGSVSMRLESPVEIAGVRYETVTAQRPKGRHVRALMVAQEKHGAAAAMIDWVVGLANLPTVFLDKIDIADTVRLQALAGFFFSSSPTAGNR